jgi:DNA-binding NtrC family response regulator
VLLSADYYARSGFLMGGTPEDIRPENTLVGRRILVVEDEYLLADELRVALKAAGAIVVGMAGSVAEALGFLASETELDAAIVDVNLAGEMVFEVADCLLGRSVPFLFTTGYDTETIPTRFGTVARLEKPLSLARVVRATREIFEVSAAAAPAAEVCCK